MLNSRVGTKTTPRISDVVAYTRRTTSFTWTTVFMTLDNVQWTWISWYWSTILNRMIAT